MRSSSTSSQVRILYEVILNQLSGERLSSDVPFRYSACCLSLPVLASGSVLSDDNGYSGYARCGDMAAFVRLLQKVTDSQGHNSQTTYIVS